LAFESVFDKVQGCVAGRQQPVRASLRASCAARPSSPPSTRCAREELDEINVFVNVFDKVAPEKPVLANAVAVAALNKTRARSLTRSTCSSPTSSTRPEKLDKVQGCVAGRQQPVRASLRASCAARPSSSPSTRCAREELDEINVFVNVFDKVAPENREARRGRGRLGQGRARGA